MLWHRRIETITHLFANFPTLRLILLRLNNLPRLLGNAVNLGDIQQIMKTITNYDHKDTWKQILQILTAYTFWTWWKARNDRIFNQATIDTEHIGKGKASNRGTNWTSARATDGTVTTILIEL